MVLRRDEVGEEETGKGIKESPSSEKLLKYQCKDPVI